VLLRVLMSFSRSMFLGSLDCPNGKATCHRSPMPVDQSRIRVVRADATHIMSIVLDKAIIWYFDSALGQICGRGD